MNDRRLGEDSVFAGMTTRQGRGIVGRMMQKQHAEQRFKLLRKAEIAEFVEDEAMNEGNTIEVRLQCVGHVLKMEAMNFEQEKLQVMVEMQFAKLDGEGDEKKEQQVIILLPPNGSEVGSG